MGFQEQRDALVDQIAVRGIQDEIVLEAMRRVPREGFLDERLHEFAYEDTPLPIGMGQTISQPYVVALMVQAVSPRPGGRVLEVGTGSGYAAAVMAEIADDVYTIERHADLAARAEATLERLGYTNVHVRHGDGTQGWPEEAPFDTILVAAGGPRAPQALLDQLAERGQLVIPVGDTPRDQQLKRYVKHDGRVHEEDLGAVRFVPLVGREGWGEEHSTRPVMEATGAPVDDVRAAALPIQRIESDDLGFILDRIGDARIVLLGESTHGTSEFYRMRARLTRELVEEKGFQIIAVEADWPDAARIDDHVRDRPAGPRDWSAFARFPRWMWRNHEMAHLVEDLRAVNGRRAEDDRVSMYGLDLYSLGTSIHAVLRYLDDVDPEAAQVARERYGCLSPWENDPATYGRAALSGTYRTCEEDAVAMLESLLARRVEDMQAAHDGRRFLDAMQNARVVQNSERYYRAMYYGSRESWNLRDRHMADTLDLLLDHHGPDSKAIVWAHNSHLGDARATEMSARGELNLGQLVRERHGADVYALGFGTDHGTVAAAPYWDGDMRVMDVNPSHPRSYGYLMHETGVPAFFLPLDDPRVAALREPRLERAIGVVYRPETELQSHYFQARLTEQFDGYIWFDRTEAVSPLPGVEIDGVPETYPFGT